MTSFREKLGRVARRRNEHRSEPKRSTTKGWLAALACVSVRRTPSAAVEAIRRPRARHGRSAHLSGASALGYLGR
eukprot:5928813-Prymnesium_polylepis.1